MIHKEADGEFIYGPRLSAGNILKLTLDGKEVLNIPPSAIPDEFKSKDKEGKPVVRLTAMDVAPNGDLYVTDGYSSDYVHRFDKTGKYLNPSAASSLPIASRRCTSSPSTRASIRRASSPATAPTAASSTCRSMGISWA
ncbi:MAG: hypothetical protein WDN28_33930 [Chthoniobacter sp.]